MWGKYLSKTFKLRKTLKKKNYKETKRAKVWHLVVDYNREVSQAEETEIGQQLGKRLLLYR